MIYAGIAALVFVLAYFSTGTKRNPPSVLPWKTDQYDVLGLPTQSHFDTTSDHGPMDKKRVGLVVLVFSALLAIVLLFGEGQHRKEEATVIDEYSSYWNYTYSNADIPWDKIHGPFSVAQHFHLNPFSTESEEWHIPMKADKEISTSLYAPYYYYYHGPVLKPSLPDPLRRTSQ